MNAERIAIMDDAAKKVSRGGAEARRISTTKDTKGTKGEKMVVISWEDAKEICRALSHELASGKFDGRAAEDRHALIERVFNAPECGSGGRNECARSVPVTGT